MDGWMDNGLQARLMWLIIEFIHISLTWIKHIWLNKPVNGLDNNFDPSMKCTHTFFPNI